MNKSFSIVLFFGCLLGILLAQAVSGTKLLVQTKDATLQSHPSKKSAKDIVVTRKTPLEASKFVKNWYKVSCTNEPSKQGWIYKGKVATANKVQDDASLKVGGKSNLLAGEEVAAGSGIRGLGPLSQKFSTRNPITAEHKRYTDYHQSYIASDREEFKPTLTERGINLVKISAQELEKFMQEGKLGEYGNVPDINE